MEPGSVSSLTTTNNIKMISYGYSFFWGWGVSYYNIEGEQEGDNTDDSKSVAKIIVTRTSQ